MKEWNEGMEEGEGGMKYRFEELDRVQVDYPDLRVEDRLWCCQIFKVLLEEPTEHGYEAGYQELRRQQERHFNNGKVSILLDGKTVFRTSAGYGDCVDPVLMVLRPMHIQEQGNQIWLVMECGLIERADLQMGRHEMLFRESKSAVSAE